MAAVLEAGERLLARVAALGERDRALVEARLGGQDPVVDLAPPARRASEDPEPLELLVGRPRRRRPRRAPRPPGRRSPCVGIPVVPPRTIADECSSSSICAPRGEAHPREMRPNRLAEPGLGEEQEVVLGPPPDEERSDHAPLRRQDQRLARLAGEHVVRDDPLEQVGGVRPLNADRGPRTEIRLGRHRSHRPKSRYPSPCSRRAGDMLAGSSGDTDGLGCVKNSVGRSSHRLESLERGIPPKKRGAGLPAASPTPAERGASRSSISPR